MFFDPSIASRHPIALLSCEFIFFVQAISKDRAGVLLMIWVLCVMFLLFLNEVTYFFIYFVKIFELTLSLIKYNQLLLLKSRKCSRYQLIS